MTVFNRALTWVQMLAAGVLVIFMTGCAPDFPAGLVVHPCSITSDLITVQVDSNPPVWVSESESGDTRGLVKKSYLVSYRRSADQRWHPVEIKETDPNLIHLIRWSSADNRTMPLPDVSAANVDPRWRLAVTNAGTLVANTNALVANTSAATASKDTECVVTVKPDQKWVMVRLGPCGKRLEFDGKVIENDRDFVVFCPTVPQGRLFVLSEVARPAIEYLNRSEIQFATPGDRLFVLIHDSIFGKCTVCEPFTGKSWSLSPMVQTVLWQPELGRIRWVGDADDFSKPAFNISDWSYEQQTTTLEEIDVGHLFDDDPEGPRPKHLGVLPEATK